MRLIVRSTGILPVALLAALAPAVCGPACADSVTLTNGDVMEGRIVRVTDAEVVLEVTRGDLKAISHFSREEVARVAYGPASTEGSSKADASSSGKGTPGDTKETDRLRIDGGRINLSFGGPYASRRWTPATAYPRGRERARRFTPADPSAVKQYMLEAINRMRADPAAAAKACGIDLNEGLPKGTISTDPKQPLVMNELLLRTAQLHTEDMIARNFFGHRNPDGLMPYSRALKQGYSMFVAENLVCSGRARLNEAQTVSWMLRLLLVDAGITNRGHRVVLMKPRYHEIGIGFKKGVVGGRTLHVATQNFGRDNGPFLTGVCYRDANRNGRYDIGEGLSGVIIRAGSVATTSKKAGGYEIRVKGTFDVTALGEGIDTTVKDVTVSGENVKLDFTP